MGAPGPAAWAALAFCQLVTSSLDVFSSGLDPFDRHGPANPFVTG